MLHDPTDETYRKPRQLRNTPLQKYIRLGSLFITLCFAGAMYISYRRHCCDPEVIKEYEAQLSEDERSMLEDYFAVPFLRGPIEKLFERQQAKAKEEAESKDTQADV